MVGTPFCEVNQIHYMPKCWRPLSSGEEDMESNVTIFSVAKDGFMHIILSFKIFAVSLKHAIDCIDIVTGWIATAAGSIDAATDWGTIAGWVDTAADWDTMAGWVDTMADHTRGY